MWGQNPMAAGPQMPTNPLIEMMRRMQQGVRPQQIVGTLAKQKIFPVLILYHSLLYNIFDLTAIGIYPKKVRPK